MLDHVDVAAALEALHDEVARLLRQTTDHAAVAIAILAPRLHVRAVAVQLDPDLPVHDAAPLVDLAAATVPVATVRIVAPIAVAAVVPAIVAAIIAPVAAIIAAVVAAIIASRHALVFEATRFLRGATVHAAVARADAGVGGVVPRAVAADDDA